MEAFGPLGEPAILGGVRGGGVVGEVGGDGDGGAATPSITSISPRSSSYDTEALASATGGPSKVLGGGWDDGGLGAPPAAPRFLPAGCDAGESNTALDVTDSSTSYESLRSAAAAAFLLFLKKPPFTMLLVQTSLGG
jgi:hypothetical protein